MPFDGDLFDRSTYPTAIGYNSYVAVGESDARFDGNAQLVLWRYRDAYFGVNLVIKFRIKEDDSVQNEIQTLISNCFIGSRQGPSIDITISPRDSTMTFRIDTENGRPSDIVLPYTVRGVGILNTMNESYTDLHEFH